MKLCRVGKLNKEKPAIIDKDGNFKDLSSIVNDFILRRVNTLNAQHLPPKLVQVVCCNLTESCINNLWFHAETTYS